MIEPDKILDEALRKGLQNRFDDLEADVKPALWKRIAGEIGNSYNGTRLYLIGSALVVGLLLVYFKGESISNWLTRTPVVKSENLVGAQKNQKQNGYITSKKPGGSKPNQFTEDRQKYTAVSQQKQGPQTRVTNQFSSAAPYSSEANKVVPEIAAHPQKQELSAGVNQAGQRRPSDHSSLQLPADSVFAAHHQTIHSLRNIEYNGGLAMNLPSVSVKQTLVSDQKIKSNKVAYLFSVIPLQTYQMLNITSNVSNRFQNFGFAPFMSLLSKGIKLNTGVQTDGFQFLMNYSFIRNWSSYEIGNGEVIVNTSADQFTMIEKGDSYTKDEKLHMLGLGVVKLVPLQGALRKFDLKVGAEYARLLKERQGFVSVNLALTRPIVYGPRQIISVGPFAELGLNQRIILDQTWKYRPYQVGIIMNMKINDTTK
jgi:hypothetical protein